MLRTVGAYILTAALVLLGSDAVRQASNEFRDTEPGSRLFGTLQLLMFASALLGAVGVFKRTTWASRSIGVWGIAAAALLLVQPVFESMDSDARRAIYLGAAVVAAAAWGMSWCARRLAAAATAPRPPERLTAPGPDALAARVARFFVKRPR